MVLVRTGKRCTVCGFETGLGYSGPGQVEESSECAHPGWEFIEEE